MTTPGRGVWLTMGEAAVLSGRKPATIRKWVERNHLAVRTVRGRQRVEASAVLVVERETRARGRRGRPHG